MSDKDGTARGVAGALRRSFQVPAETDPDMQRLIEEIERKYRPDAAADARFDQLLERLQRLPWDNETAER